MKKTFGHLKPKFNFSLNPYPDQKFTKCPDCNKKTGQRKLPLFVHVEPRNPIFINYKNRYCNNCDMLIGHKHEIESYLLEAFQQIDASIIGNDYLIIGTIEKKAWKDNIQQPIPFNELQNYVHDFKTTQTISMTMGGWFPTDKEPPVLEPPTSRDWVKK